MIIKITGRYHVMDNSFFNKINLLESSYDVFIKFFNVCTLKFLSYDCVLGLFAIKCKFLKQFNYSINPASAEVEFASFVRNLNCCADDLRILDI